MGVVLEGVRSVETSAHSRSVSGYVVVPVTDPSDPDVNGICVNLSVGATTDASGKWPEPRMMFVPGDRGYSSFTREQFALLGPAVDKLFAEYERLWPWPKPERGVPR